MKYLIVAIEYFTKWIEAEPVAQITSHKVQHFVWKNIVCRFGVLRRLISDNGTQFASLQMSKMCSEVGIKQVFASVEHPQTNGQVESVNRILLRGLKRRLEKAKGVWAEEVPRIVWAYHTTPQSSTMETPFSLVYGSDAMIPVEEFNEESPGVGVAMLRRRQVEASLMSPPIPTGREDRGGGGTVRGHGTGEEASGPSTSEQ